MRTLPLAAITRTSYLGKRNADSETFHATEDERDEITQYAAELGREIVFLPPELDVKGGLPIRKRPSLRAGIEGVEAGIYGGLIFGDIKRATRAEDGYRIWNRVERVGGRVYTALERLDTATWQGRKQRNHAIAEAVAEREMHAARYAKRRKKTLDAGIWRGEKPPTGFDFTGPMDHDGRYRGSARKLKPGERAGEVLAAFEAADRGDPLSTIALALGMSRAGVSYLLKNRVYLGELHEGGRPVEDAETGKVIGTTPKYSNPKAHDPIPGLTPELFERVQRRLGEKANGWPRPRALRNSRPPGLTQGLVVCASCSHAMSPIKEGDPRGVKSMPRPAVYRCQGGASGGACPSPTVIVQGRLHDHVEAIVRWHVAWLRADGKRDARARLRTARAEHAAAIQRRKDAVARLLRAGGSEDDPDAEQPLSIHDDAIKAAWIRVAEADRVTQTGASFTNGDRAIETPGDLRQAVLDLVEAVVVFPVGQSRYVAIDDRVVVLAKGANLGPRKRGTVGWPVESVDLERFKGPDVLRILLPE